MPTPVTSEPSIPCSAVCVDAQLQPGDLARCPTWGQMWSKDIKGTPSLSTVRIMIRYDKVSYSKQEGCKGQDCPNYGSWSMQSMHGAFGPGFATQSAAQAEAGEPHPGAASSNGGCWWLRSLSKSGEILHSKDLQRDQGLTRLTILRSFNLSMNINFVSICFGLDQFPLLSTYSHFDETGLRGTKSTNNNYPLVIQHSYEKSLFE